ncbi:MAG: hydrolase [Alphaproteobacteria bacterium CG_4_10_14_0_2_um_filter_63_37]|nr:MAG: hydrolase [Proteobacteria bacterium CG1_02_64_396]PJA25772.1 MAG: hydrolase [Alphaproteobacteria bacterium CG_4_10_14_0_2_um_filter_63_37]
MLAHAPQALLVVVDIQERLASAMPETERLRVEVNAVRLIRGAQLLAVPIVGTRQYPKGLGPFTAPIQDALSGHAQVVDKTSFSCCGEDGFSAAVAAQARQQIVLCGMESHVCVLQTATELLERGHVVFVAADAVCSRDRANRRNALTRMRQSGVIVTNTESILFEWLRDARHDRFKAISALVR